MDDARQPSRRLYGAAIFLSAFLLFQIQPVLAKLILPWFGGAAGVWIVTLAFYQAVYLLGNLYAHVLLRRGGLCFSARFHAVALFVSLVFLPILPNTSWKPIGAGDPSWRILELLAATIGLPFLLLSATSSLLQGWYAAGREGGSPYRFYALSNAGSLLALLSYPFAVEPMIRTRTQAALWSVGYGGFVTLCGLLALRQPSAKSAPAATATATRPAWTVQILWFLLAAVPSMLLLSVTNHVSQNIAPVPLLWIAPLSIYLFSLIICFESARPLERVWYRRGFFLPSFALAVAAMGYSLSPQFEKASPAIQIPLYLAGLFICCIACHGELAGLKPGPEYLTHFYLLLAAGGAAGGLFVAILAPRVFYQFYELPLALALCPVCVLAALLLRTSSKRENSSSPVPLLATLTTAILIVLIVYVQSQGGRALLTLRTFYGVLRVSIVPGGSNRPAVTQLKHGTIVHGEEIADEARNDTPTTYYGEHSGAGISLLLERQRGPLDVGVVGEGIATLARYGQKGDHYVFYEINPQVIDLAQNLFDFVKQSEAQIEIVPGDGRLSLEREMSRQFDVLIVDAFSGDAIPVHLLTREAFALYFQRLKPHGLLAIHVTNSFLDLTQVVAAGASPAGYRAIEIDNIGDEANAVYASTWMLLDQSESTNSTLRALIDDKLNLPKGTSVHTTAANVRPWSDDYSNLIQIVKW